MTKAPPPSSYLAALDLGSNSFHLLISQSQTDAVTPFITIERHKTMVQLARGIDADGNLSPAALNRARECLLTFSQYLQAYPQVSLSVVGTQALRQCTNLNEFLAIANPILGQPVEIISAEREASLVYRGVQHTLPAETRNDRVLLIDIGGASTELIIGKGTELQTWHSFELGCVDLVNRFFSNPERPITDALQQAYQYSYNQLLFKQQHFCPANWDTALGASGTMRVILPLLAPSGSIDRINRQQLSALLENLKRHGCMPDSVPESMRFDVLPAGLALLQAVFDVFSVDTLSVSNGSIKEGMLLELQA